MGNGYVTGWKAIAKLLGLKIPGAKSREAADPALEALIVHRGKGVPVRARKRDLVAYRKERGE